MKKTTLSIGLAMFSMFFGAGNIIFPLALGQLAQDQNLIAVTGLIITAVLIPFAGVFAMILFDGNTKAFFGRLGKTAGLLVALLVITLLGPCGSTPRCIALTYGTVKSFLPALSPTLFSLLSCGIIYLFSFRKNKMISFLGTYLTPLLLAALGIIVFIGLNMASEATTPSFDSSLFFHGLKEGYNTMDLLAAFFFSSAIIGILKENHYEKPLQLTIGASVIGAILLSLVYLGFSTLASMHASDLHVGKDTLLSAIAFKIAGPIGGVLVCITIALACLTTAIALISVFSDFISKEIGWNYNKTLLISLAVTFFVATYEFTGISAFLGPFLELCYPSLIVLTLLNIGHKLWGIKMLKWPVFATFALTIFSSL